MSISNKRYEKLRKILNEKKVKQRHYCQKSHSLRAVENFRRPVYHLGK